MEVLSPTQRVAIILVSPFIVMACFAGIFVLLRLFQSLVSNINKMFHLIIAVLHRIEFHRKRVETFIAIRFARYMKATRAFAVLAANTVILISSTLLLNAIIIYLCQTWHFNRRIYSLMSLPFYLGYVRIAFMMKTDPSKCETSMPIYLMSFFTTIALTYEILHASEPSYNLIYMNFLWITLFNLFAWCVQTTCDMLEEN